MTDSIDNRLRMAQAHIAHREYAEAKELLSGARDNALYRNAPNLLLAVAQVEYAQGRPQHSRATLEALIATNPAFRSHEGHLTLCALTGRQR